MSSDRLTIEVKPPDHTGKYLVTARMNGTSLPNRLDLMSQFHRKGCREAIISRFALDDTAHEWIEAELLKGAEAADNAPLFKPVIKLLSDFTPKTIRWFWPNRIAIGKNNLLCGDPGLGKSLCHLDLIARGTTDRGFPDGTHSEFGPCGAVILTMEDDAEDTLVPRLMAARADLSRVALVQGVSEVDGDGTVIHGIDLATDLSAVREAVLQVPNCRLVVVDTIADYLGSKIDSHKNRDVRSVMNPFAALAAEMGFATLCVAHMRKSEGKAVHSTMGSIGFVGQARVAWAVTRCQTHPKRRLLTCIKNNLADDTSGLAYEITNYGDDGQPVLAWEAEPVRMSADEAMAQNRKPPGPKPDDKNAAADWLARYLRNGDMPAGAVLTAAEEAGHKPWTIRRAFKQLECTRHKESFEEGWIWALPQDDNNEAEDSATRNLSPSSPSTNPEDYTHSNSINQVVRAKVTGSPCGDVRTFENFEAERKDCVSGKVTSTPPF